MKKILLIIAIAFLCSINCKSQDLKYGFRLGINHSNLKVMGLKTGNINDYDGKAKNGFVLGGFAEYRMQALGLAAELLYSQQGCKTNSNSKNSRDIDLGYISLSPIAKIYLLKWLNLQLGFHLNYNAFGNKTLIANVKEYNETTLGYDTKEFKTDIKKWNTGLLTGIEMCIHKNILLTYRLFFINDEIVKSDIAELNLSNFVSQFSLGYKF